MREAALPEQPGTALVDRKRWGNSVSMGKAKMAAILLTATLLAYAALLGWDTTYQVDPVTQQVSGP